MIDIFLLQVVACSWWWQQRLGVLGMVSWTAMFLTGAQTVCVQLQEQISKYKTHYVLCVAFILHLILTYLLSWFVSGTHHSSSFASQSLSQWLCLSSVLDLSSFVVGCGGDGFVLRWR